MNIQGDGYSLTFQDNDIRISGKLSLMLEDYSALEKFFQQVIATHPAALTLDIRNLEYLNSSGIKTICVSLILEVADIEGLSLKILCSNRFTWQKETIPTFEDLMENMEILFT